MVRAVQCTDLRNICTLKTTFKLKVLAQRYDGLDGVGEENTFKMQCIQ